MTSELSALSELLLTKPDTSRGHYIGADDWKLVVEVLLPSDGAALWGYDEWGEGEWGEMEWHDLTDYVRGLEWSRGADGYLGRPRIGQASITLDNNAGDWSPWNPSPPVGSSAYFAPGAIIRCGVTSVNDTRAQGWIPQFVIITDQWSETSSGAGADTWIEIVGYEVLRDLASIDDNALSSVVGNGDLASARIERLIRDVFRFPMVVELGGPNAYTMQSTDMSQNRLAECYVTADSSDLIFRSGRMGEAFVTYTMYDYPTSFDKVVSQWQCVAFSWATRAGYKIPYLQFWAKDPQKSSNVWTLSYDADSCVTSTDDEHIVNDARFARVGGTQQVHEQPASIGRYGRRTLSRSDLMNDDDADVLEIAEQYTRRRALHSLRVESVTVSTSDRGTEPYLAAIAADIGVPADVFPPGYASEATFPTGDGPHIWGHIETMVHRVTPRSDNSVTWQSEFGVSTNIVQDMPAAQLPHNALD